MVPSPGHSHNLTQNLPKTCPVDLPRGFSRTSAELIHITRTLAAPPSGLLSGVRHQASGIRISSVDPDTAQFGHKIFVTPFDVVGT